MQRIEDKIIHAELSYKIYGLCFKIHNELGRYRNEKAYADAFEHLLKEGGIEYKRETALEKSFEGERNRRNIPDFIIENKVISDVKAKRVITKDDYYQMKRYLASSKNKLGIIVNFRQLHITPKRVLN